MIFCSSSRSVRPRVITSSTAGVIYLPGGLPVSGRLRAVVYVDADADRATGWDLGPDDLRTGAEYRLEVGVLALGADEEEKLPAQALVTAFLASLGRDG